MGQDMENIKEGKREESEEEKWVYDGSLDYKGRVPLRASTGAWKASIFVLMVEISERIEHFALSANLISYLTEVMHEDLKTATKNRNIWDGTASLMPLIGGFVADAYTGRYYLVLFSSFIYLTGLILLTISQYIPSLKPCNTKICHHPKKVHEVVFIFSIYIKSLGTGGYRPCLQSFGADQFDDNHLEERKKKVSFFNWWSFGLCFAYLLGDTVIVYVQDFVGWGVASLFLVILMTLSVITFFVGSPFYRYRRPEGNTLTPILQVLIAAIRKRNLSCPSNPALLYEVPKSDKSQGRLLSHTSSFRFLDKAAIIEEKYVEQKVNPWRLATVTRVEETKLVLNMVPIWLTLVLVGLCGTPGSTLFVKQAAAMNLKIGDSFKIPPASVASISVIGTLVAIPIYDKVIIPILRKVTGNERGISILKKIGIGLAFSVIVMVVSALVEAKRLRMVGHEVLIEGEEAKQKTMSALWLIPQNLIAGFGDLFSSIGQQEYFYDQVPDSMRSLGMALYFSTGVGSFLGNFLINIVNHVTGKNGKIWIGKDVNSSRLDYFYWVLAIISALNLCVFIFLAERYPYKTVQEKYVETETSDCKSDEVEMTAL